MNRRAWVSGPRALLLVAGVALAGCSSATPSRSDSTSATSAPSTSATESPVPSRAPSSRLAFQSDGRIQVLAPSGGISAVAASAPLGQEHPDWSPDGSRIAFETDFSVLWVAESDGSKATQVFECTRPCYKLQDAAWSPDGSSIAFVAAETTDGTTTSRSAVLRLDLATQTVTTIYADTSHRVWLFSPRWSPDATRLVVEEETFASDGLDESSITGSKIGIVRAESAKPTIRYVATSPAGRLSGVDWSPAGDLIVLAREDDLVTVRADGTGATPITAFDGVERHAVQPTFTPDGAGVVFTYVEGTFGVGERSTAAQVAIDGTGFTTLGEGQRMTHPRLARSGPR